MDESITQNFEGIENTSFYAKFRFLRIFCSTLLSILKLMAFQVKEISRISSLKNVLVS